MNRRNYMTSASFLRLPCKMWAVT